MNEINTMLYNFLWNGKPDKMRRSLAKQKMSEGGIGMIDVSLFDKSLKLTWIRRFFKHQSRWKDLIQVIYPFFKDIKNFGNTLLQQFFEDIQNPFWKNVLTYYHYFKNILKLKQQRRL